jgi:hypothetical protein
VPLSNFAIVLWLVRDETVKPAFAEHVSVSLKA